MREEIKESFVKGWTDEFEKMSALGTIAAIGAPIAMEAIGKLRQKKTPEEVSAGKAAAGGV